MRLGREHRLWLVTHGSSALQRRKLRLAELEEHFDLVLVSGEVGLLKDDVAFAGLIDRELQRSGLSLRAVVGDGAGDLRLAAHGGWPAVHICPQPCDTREPAVQHRRTLADVPAALG